MKLLKDKKVKKLLIVLVFILILLILAVMIITSYKSESHKKLLYINSDEYNGEEYPYMGYKLFVQYEGNLTSDNMTKSMSYVANEIIPEYYLKFKNLSDAEIKEYYNTEVNDIRMDLGIENEEKFITFVNAIKALKAEQLVFSSYKIDDTSINVTNSYTAADLYIRYGEEELKVRVQVLNSMKEKSSSVIYSVIE